MEKQKRSLLIGKYSEVGTRNLKRNLRSLRFPFFFFLRALRALPCDLRNNLLLGCRNFHDRASYPSAHLWKTMTFFKSLPEAPKNCLAAANAYFMNFVVKVYSCFSQKSSGSNLAQILLMFNKSWFCSVLQSFHHESRPFKFSKD